MAALPARGALNPDLTGLSVIAAQIQLEYARPGSKTWRTALKQRDALVNAMTARERAHLHAVGAVLVTLGSAR